MSELGIKVGALFFGAVLLMVWLAYTDGILTPVQMTRRFPVGFPLIANGGVWGDAFLLPPVFALIIAICGHEWREDDILLTTITGTFGSILMHKYVYLTGKFPDALAGPNGLSLAGAVHVMYMAAGLTIIQLFILSAAPRHVVVIVGIILALHMIVANHVPLNELRKIYHWSWLSNIFKEEANPLRIMASTTLIIAAGSAIKYAFPGSVLALLR